MEANHELKYIFSNVNDWLKFAEVKHGGLIILNSGFVIGILSSYNNIQGFIDKPCIMIGVICFGISVFLSIISQFPITQNIVLSHKSDNNPNLYFFAHLSRLDVNQVVNELKAIDASYGANKLDLNLINQILKNSRITQAKYSLFKYASYLTAFGAGLIGISSIAKVIWHL